MIVQGLDSLVVAPPSWLAGNRLGLLTNQASVSGNLIHGRELIQRHFGKRLTTLFSPQHGFYSEKQDNMIESANSVDEVTGLPIYSLYGEFRKPTAQMLAKVDVLLIDLVDVGTRVYTFMYTMAYCLEAAAENGKKVVILDRINPIGGTVEGNILEHDCRSFVGLYPIPMRHGLTMGELAMMFNQEFNIGCDLEVIKVEGWNRSMYFDETGLPWVYPSPNMPTLETALVYPGQVIWEGTNISEGRGTTKPFELVGAPFIDPFTLIAQIDADLLPGCFLRPVYFEPTSGKWARKVCGGVQLHVTDREVFKPYRTSLTLLQAILAGYPDDFKYADPPYEYEFERLPLDLILGSQKLREDLEHGVAITKLEEQWLAATDEFIVTRDNYLLYAN